MSKEDQAVTIKGKVPVDQTGEPKSFRLRWITGSRPAPIVDKRGEWAPTIVLTMQSFATLVFEVEFAE